MIEPPLPHVKSLRVFPAERILAPGALDQQLVVTALFATARLATSPARPPTMSATRPASTSRSTGKFTPAALRNRRSPFAT